MFGKKTALGGLSQIKIKFKREIGYLKRNRNQLDINYEKIYYDQFI